MAKSRSATPVLFGFDFQTNAAIVLMLENIEAMSTIRVEGEEDIQILLNNGSYVLAQAKSVVNSSTDFRNIRAASKKAVITLSEAASRLDVKEIVYITNSPNPLKDDASKSMFYGNAHVKYENLPKSTQKLIDGWLSKSRTSLDTNKFKIRVIPFETDDDRQRYKVVWDSISDFIGRIGISADGLKMRLHEVWSNSLSKNGSRQNKALTLSKKDIVWPIIVFFTDKNRIDRDGQYCELLDEGEYEELLRKYGEIIDYYSERYDFAIKVVTDYTASGLKGKDAVGNFVERYWENYKTEIGDEEMDDDIRTNLVKAILHNIVSKRINIDKIKRAVNL